MENPSPSTGPVDLRREARDCRRIWRWHWQRLWLLRWENALRRPGWRVDEEAFAWCRMRAEVRRYAALRRQLAAGPDDRQRYADPHAGIQKSLTTIHR
jgi:hypothetical protein